MDNLLIFKNQHTCFDPCCVISFLFAGLFFCAGPFKQIYFFCAIASRIQFDNFASNSNLRKLSKDVLHIHSMSFPTVFWFKPLYNNFVRLSQHSRTSTSHRYARRHISNYTKQGVNNMRVFSYTHVYFGGRELHACHTRVYGLELSITTVAAWKKQLVEKV